MKFCHNVCESAFEHGAAVADASLKAQGGIRSPRSRLRNGTGRASLAAAGPRDTLRRQDSRLGMMKTRTILAAIVLVIGMTDYDYARPIDPFGGNTVDVPQGLLVERWHAVYNELDADHALLGACVDSTSSGCGPSRTLWKIIAEAREQEGLAQIGHINRAINLSITPVEPSEWLTALEAIDADGDCKAYATAKYFALRELGVASERVRLVIVHERNSVDDHIIVAVYQDDQWLILDNLTLALVQDTDESKYAPLFVLDDHGVRQIKNR